MQRTSQPKTHTGCRLYYQVDRTSVSRSATRRWFYGKMIFCKNLTSTSENSMPDSEEAEDASAFVSYPPVNITPHYRDYID